MGATSENVVVVPFDVGEDATIEFGRGRDG